MFVFNAFFFWYTPCYPLRIVASQKYCRRLYQNLHSTLSHRSLQMISFAFSMYFTENQYEDLPYAISPRNNQQFAHILTVHLPPKCLP